jgi:hypothetical protein
VRNTLPKLPLPRFTLHNFDDVDRALSEWRSRLQVVDDNLRELDDEPTLAKLEGRPGVPAIPLEGETALRVGPALRALRDVWAYRDRLANAIDRADDIRKSVFLKPWSEGKQMQAIDDLLNGPSVVLLGAKIPLALRSLAATAQEQNRVTPAGLLQAMESAFADARDAVFAVDTAWTTLLPSPVQAGRVLDALRARASRLGVALDAEFSDVAGTLDTLRRQVERDPLGALKTSMVDLKPHLDRLRAQLDALEHVRTSVAADLARAGTLLEQVLETNAAASEARRRSLAEIRDPLGLLAPLSVEQIEGLRPWLATLQSTVDQGHWSAARVGLDRWLGSAADYLNAAESARAANCAALAKRDELAGLLRARGAQAADMARQGLYLPSEAEAAARRANTLLAELPCRVDAAEAAVTQFDAAVRVLAQSARRGSAGASHD